MPKLSEFYGIIIEIRFREHGVPHFHAHYEEGEVSIGIRPLSILAGHIKARALALVIEWATIHQAELLAAWNNAQAGINPGKISPLD